MQAVCGLAIRRWFIFVRVYNNNNNNNNNNNFIQFYRYNLQCFEMAAYKHSMEYDQRSFSQNTPAM